MAYIGAMLTIRIDGSKLRRLRERRGLSVAALAEAAGRTHWAIYGIEQGRSQPSAQVYARIKSALQAADTDLTIDDEDSACPSATSAAAPAKSPIPVTAEATPSGVPSAKAPAGSEAEAAPTGPSEGA